LGIKPTRPETGYGYIASLDALEGSEICSVDSFREKPSLELAKDYLAAGNYLWNAGIFVWNVDTIVSSMREFAPSIASKMDQMAPAFFTEQESEVVAEVFPTCEKISIDYAVMEKADYIYTVPGDFGWSDVGTWGSLRALLPHDADSNAVVGENVHLNDCKGCIVHAPGAESVVLQGLEDCIVVQRGGRTLVCRLSEEQRIKDFAK
jgi:mannose-1-phosphate guanylyltransferase